MHSLLPLSLISPSEHHRKGNNTDKDNLKLILEYAAFMIVISILSAGKKSTNASLSGCRRLTAQAVKKTTLFSFFFLSSITEQH